MKLGLFQFDVIQGQPAETLGRVLAGTEGLEVDLLVLPDLCTSGYLLTPERAAELAVEESFPVVANCLDDDPGVRNAFHVFVQDKPAWYPIGDGAKQFQGHPAT
jgi:predicted amidohydrolase